MSDLDERAPSADGIPAMPPARGNLPSPANPDPAPGRDEHPAREPRTHDETGQPIGRDNIREGRVGGVMGTPRGQGGQGG